MGSSRPTTGQSPADPASSWGDPNTQCDDQVVTGTNRPALRRSQSPRSASPSTASPPVAALDPSLWRAMLLVPPNRGVEGRYGSSSAPLSGRMLTPPASSAAGSRQARRRIQVGGGYRASSPGFAGPSSTARIWSASLDADPLRRRPQQHGAAFGPGTRAARAADGPMTGRAPGHAPFGDHSHRNRPPAVRSVGDR